MRWAVLFLALCVGGPATGAERPNIVFILADDLGYGDLGCYNPTSKIPTPNLDRLAGEGIRCTDAHAPTSVCTPTRYAILTGRYCWRSRLQRGVLGPWGKPLIPAERLTVASMLKKQGYRTACIGKWHLGWEWPTKDGKPPQMGADKLSNVDYTKPIAAGPITVGFDSYFGTDVPNYPPFCFIENDHTVGIPSVRFDGPRDGPAVPGWKWVDILPGLTQRAVAFVEDAGAKAKVGDEPFFLYLPLTSPHYPVVPAPEFHGKSRAGEYGDFVHQTDWTVGRVLDALQRTGVAENTLVIFTSDNGPEMVPEVTPGAYDRIRQYGHASMGDLRGAKRDTWEGGHRVPFIASWPGHIAPGSVSGELISHVDFMATVAAITGLTAPANAGEDSFNILPVLTGAPHDKPIREAVVHHSGGGRFGIRRGEWVLIVQGTGDDNGRNGEPDWFRKQRGYGDDGNTPGQLFHVTEDPTEKHNLYAQHPEIVKDLTALLAQYIADGRSTPGSQQANDVEVQMIKNVTPGKKKG